MTIHPPNSFLAITIVLFPLLFLEQYLCITAARDTTFSNPLRVHFELIHSGSVSFLWKKEVQSMKILVENNPYLRTRCTSTALHIGSTNLEERDPHLLTPCHSKGFLHTNGLAGVVCMSVCCTLHVTLSSIDPHRRSIQPSLCLVNLSISISAERDRDTLDDRLYIHK